MTDDVDTTGCLTKAQAAQVLGTSTKAIERAVQAGELVQHWRRQVGTPDVAVYFPDEVAALVAKRAQARRRGPSGGVLVPGSGVQAFSPANGNGHGVGMSTFHRPEDRDSTGVSGALSPLLPSTVTPAPEWFLTAAQRLVSQTSQTSQTPTLYVTVKEAAAILGLPQVDVRRLIHDGDLNHRLTGRGGIRIRRKDLEAV